MATLSIAGSDPVGLTLPCKLTYNTRFAQFSVNSVKGFAHISVNDVNLVILLHYRNRVTNSVDVQ